MSELYFDKRIKNQFDTLPQGWAWYAVSGTEGYLLSGYTANLKNKLKFLQNKADEGGFYADMWKQASNVNWTIHPSNLNALIHYKCFVAENSPVFQHRLLPWEQYAYLALDAYRFPFTSIQEHTNEDWLYIGPFRSRFFLADVIEVFSCILKLPACDTSSYPCSKFDTNVCRGWCLSIAPSRESKNEHSLEKLDTLLKETYLHPDNGILELVQKERDDYFNDLEFAKAALLDDEIELMGKYRDWLKFLYVAKSLEFESPELVIHKGRIQFCTFNGRGFHFPVDSTEFRANESLALNLDCVDESRIIYEYLVNPITS